MANYFDVDDIIRRAANGEFGDPGVGGGGDELGGYGVGGDADEFGAYAGVGNWALALQRSPAAMAQNLARKAQAGRLSKSDIAAILQMLGNRCAPPVAPGYGVPFPGFGGPVGPGKGSTGVAIGIGTGSEATVWNQRLRTVKNFLTLARKHPRPAAFERSSRAEMLYFVRIVYPLARA